MITILQAVDFRELIDNYTIEKRDTTLRRDPVFLKNPDDFIEIPRIIRRDFIAFSRMELVQYRENFQKLL